MDKRFGLQLTGIRRISYDTIADLPAIGDSTYLYYVIDSNSFYYWNGSAYIPAGSGIPSGALTNDITDGAGWNANTNDPEIVSGVGNEGDFAVVAVEGTTTIDGISVWKVGDYIWWDNDNSVWRKIDNQGTIAVSNRVDIVVNNENEFEDAYTLINDVYDGGTIYFGSSFNLTKNHSFSAEGIVFECDYNRLYMAGNTITITGNSCFFINGFFDGYDTGGTPASGSQFIFSAGSVSTNYNFYNCRFHQFLEAGSAEIFDMTNVAGSAHLVLKECWFSGETTINAYVVQIKVSSSSDYADTTILLNRSVEKTTQTRLFGFTGTKPSVGLDFLFDGSCLFSNTVAPDDIFNITGRTEYNFIFYEDQQALLKVDYNETFISDSKSSHITAMEYSTNDGSSWADVSYPISIAAGDEIYFRVKTYASGKTDGNIKFFSRPY